MKSGNKIMDVAGVQEQLVVHWPKETSLWLENSSQSGSCNHEGGLGCATMIGAFGEA